MPTRTTILLAAATAIVLAGLGCSDSSSHAYDDCSCTDETTSWACYCHGFDCGKQLSAYSKDPSQYAQYTVVVEYGGCNLVMVTTFSAGYREEVFDMTTGKLVGEWRYEGAGMACPFGGDAGLTSLRAGQFPDSSCVRTACRELGMGVDGCMSFAGDGGSPGS